MWPFVLEAQLGLDGSGAAHGCVDRVAIGPAAQVLQALGV
jgi:hypothetical protein